MRNKKAYLVVPLFVPLFVLVSPEGLSATCSCAGISLSNSINLSEFESETWQLAYSYSNIDISDLVSGSKQINDETGRFRETHSSVVQATYGINDHWSVTGIVSYVEHERNNSISNTLIENSNGLGDSLIVVGYTVQKIDPFNRNEWSIGLGIRIPTGEDKNGAPIIFAEDLQPGQGAWGESIWLHYAHSFNQKANPFLSIDLNYINNEENDRDYSFGNEWNIKTGLNYSFAEQWQLSGSLNYRDASPHTRFGADFPNTGGTWLDFSAGLQYALNESLVFSLSATVPLSRDLKGALQFTTSNSITTSIGYTF